MKKEYKPVEMDVITFTAEDVIVTSGDCRWEGEEG